MTGMEEQCTPHSVITRYHLSVAHVGAPECRANEAAFYSSESFSMCSISASNSFINSITTSIHTTAEGGWEEGRRQFWGGVKSFSRHPETAHRAWREDRLGALAELQAAGQAAGVPCRSDKAEPGVT